MTRTEIITKELLEAVDRPETVDAVYARHADSRGPFYKALAEATGILRGRYNGLAMKVRQEKDREVALRSSVSQLENRLGKMQESEGKLAKITEQKQAVMDRLKELSAAGLGEDQLGRLVEVLGGWTAKSGLKPAEAVDRFLDAASRVTDILTLEQERARAEKEKAAAEAEAKKAVALSKLTTDVIEAGKWLVSQHLSAKMIFAWRDIAQQLGLPVEKLSQGLADALKQYGTLDAACRTKITERDELTKQVEKLKAETTTLQAEKQRIQTALEAVAKDGQGRVQAAEKIATSAVNSVKDQTVAAIKATREEFEETMGQADQYMATTIRRFKQLTEEAAELEQDIAFARALRSNDPMPWLKVTSDSWDAVFARFLTWAKIHHVNGDVPIPDEVKKGGKGSIEYPSLHGQYRLPLPTIMGWLKAGLKGAPATNPTLPWSFALERLTGRSSLGQ
ncbi:MAG: hypothetical protein M0Z41_18805 [Peptococcaceae bacterium]|nr:hypothetical protein [Peptococcaceae bacterium]